MIQFLVDESCGAVAVRALRKLGYDVIFAAEASPGKTDADILAWGPRDQCVIVAEDRNFCEPVFENKLPTCGIVPGSTGMGGNVIVQTALTRNPAPQRPAMRDWARDLHAHGLPFSQRSDRESGSGDESEWALTMVSTKSGRTRIVLICISDQNRMMKPVQITHLVNQSAMTTALLNRIKIRPLPAS